MMRLILVIGVSLMASLAIADSSNEQLIQKVKELSQRSQAFDFSEADWERLRLDLSGQQASLLRDGANDCDDANVELFYNTYAVSFDSQGQLCRIYDLSFPHLKLLGQFGKRTVGSVSAQKFKARDFLNWIKGNYDDVFTSIRDFENAKASDLKGMNANWVEKLKFKQSFQPARTFKLAGQNLPASFRGSDIEVGEFQFSDSKKGQLQDIIQSIVATGYSENLQKNADAWLAIIDRPEKLLANLKFDWNTAKKVYEIAIEGQFLPIAGPIALVDTGRPYKVFVESLLRNVVQMAVEKLVTLVPPPAGNLVGFALTEAFMSIDRAYGYQTNRLEATLRHDLEFPSEILRSQDALEGLNLVFLSHTDVVGEYIQTMALGKKFPWHNLKGLGGKQKYMSEKYRDITMDRTHDRLVRKSGCESKIFSHYFSNCKRSDSLKIYSLISEFTLFGYSFGAPMIHDFNSPHIVVAKRGVSYLLAAATSLVDLPIPNWILGNLSTILKDYATVGIQDEAFLQADLSIRNSSSDSILRNALHLQNLNPLTPKSMGHEQKIINANKQLLGIQ